MFQYSPIFLICYSQIQIDCLPNKNFNFFLICKIIALNTINEGASVTWCTYRARTCWKNFWNLWSKGWIVIYFYNHQTGWNPWNLTANEFGNFLKNKYRNSTDCLKLQIAEDSADNTGNIKTSFFLWVLGRILFK